MKLYSVKPEWCYGDDKEQKRAEQLELLKQIGVKECEHLGLAICTADQAIELFAKGYCGTYVSIGEHIKIIHETEPEIDIEAIISASVASSAEAVGRLFNSKCNQEQPGPSLMQVDETMLKEDCCTDELQEALANGWRILAVCPQPQRRPDYVLGRKFVPKSVIRSTFKEK